MLQLEDKILNDSGFNCLHRVNILDCRVLFVFLVGKPGTDSTPLSSLRSSLGLRTPTRKSS